MIVSSGDETMGLMLDILNVSPGDETLGLMLDILLDNPILAMQQVTCQRTSV